MLRRSTRALSNANTAAVAVEQPAEKKRRVKKEIKEEPSENISETKTLVTKQAVKQEVKTEPTDECACSTTEETKPDVKPKASRKKAVAEGESDELKHMRLTVGQRVLDAAQTAGSDKMLGVHVSAAGSLEQSIYNATSIGCRAFALFLRNQRQWVAKPMEEETVQRWNRAMLETCFPVSQILPHGSYLMNPGSPDQEKLEKTRAAMLDECQRAERLGIQLYNFHPGSTTGSCTREECLRTVAETINYIIDNTTSICMVIETMAGQGHTVGGKFEEIRDMIALVSNKSRVGVCIDTCHIFAAGYDIRTRDSYDATMTSFGEVVGFGYLKALHINDSKGELGCHLDRHEFIGKGKIGRDAFGFIMNDERFAGLPLILETPDNGQYPDEMRGMYEQTEK